jgi:hypothetical protein
MGFNIEIAADATRANRSRLPHAILAVGLLAGLAVRLWLAAAYRGDVYVDNAKVGLMAMHALRGRFYAFFWGQPQLGSLESVVIAPVFAAFGVSDFTLGLGLLPWFVLFSIALYFVTRRCGGEGAAGLALFLSAFASPLVQIHQTTALSGYAATLALGTSLLWLTLALVYDQPTPSVRRVELTAFGLISGLAFWNSWLVAPYLLACGIYLLLDDPLLPLRYESLDMAVAFFVGSLPWWMHNLRYGFSSLGLLSVERHDRLAALVWALSRGVPAVIGVRDADGGFRLGWIAFLAAGVAFLAAAVGAWRPRRDVCALLRRRPREASPAAILLVLVVSSVSLYVYARPTRFQIDRYLLPVASATLPMTAMAIHWLSRRSRVAGSAIGAAAIAYYALGVQSLHADFEHSPQRSFTRGAERLGRALEKKGIRCGYADRPEAALVTYLTRERVVLTDYHELDYPTDEIELSNPALVLKDRSAEKTLRALNATFSATPVGGYVVYWPIRYDGVPRRPLPRGGWKLTANAAAEDVDLALDGDASTCWHAPEKPDQRPVLTLDLGRGETISGVSFTLPHEAPEGFGEIDVEASLDGERWKPVKKAAFDFPLSFGSDGRARVLPDDRQLVLFPPRPARWLRMTLGEAHGWSVSELDVFGVAEGAMTGMVLPATADPSSFQLVERRLRRALDREPFSNRSFRALESMYQSHGDAAALAALRRDEALRFRPEMETDWRFGDAVTLLGYDLRQLGNRTFEIRYYWQAERGLSSDLAASVHLERGVSQMNEDYFPGAPAHPSSTWQPGEIVVAERRMTIPEEMPAGEYEMKIGVWDPRTKRRFALHTSRWIGSEGRTALITLTVGGRHLAGLSPAPIDSSRSARP